MTESGGATHFTGLSAETEAGLLSGRGGEFPASAGQCFACGAVLCADDIGAHKKFVNRGADTFLCIPCLAALYKVDETALREKIEYFRRTGCTLFAPLEEGAGQ